MIHPDIDTRVGAHCMFSAIVVRGPGHPRSESEYLYETKKQSRTTSVFASATALLEKLRKEKDNLGSDKSRNMMPHDVKERNMHEEDNKHAWARKNLAYFSKMVYSFIDGCTAPSSSLEVNSL
jgi:protein EFR3